MIRLAMVVLVLGACARGATPFEQDGSLQTEDAPRPPDARDEETFDAAIDATGDAMADAPRPDAMVDAMVDAPPPPDAMVDAMVVPDACVPMIVEKLTNPAFDSTPRGTGWVQDPIDNSYPIITGDGDFAEHTAPYKAWMGGFVASSGQVTDVMTQQVVFPADTTSVTLTGYYAVGTEETGSTAYDTASVALVDMNDVLVENALVLSNLTPTTTWTAFSKTFTTNVAGRTLKLRFTSSADDSYNTNFFFDSMSLKATHCP